MIIRGTDEADYISNTLEGATIQPGNGNDTIYNTARNVLISVGTVYTGFGTSAGNKTINNESSWYSTIDCGLVGNDTMKNSGWFSVIAVELITLITITAAEPRFMAAWATVL